MEQKQKAIISGVNINNQKNFRESMKELESLAEACDIEVVGEMTQNLSHENRSHYLGKGKIEEIMSLREALEADMIIFDDELAPSQIRNLEEALHCDIIDRTVLILDIFARRARTKEAKMQVEIAKMQYMLPRLAGFGETMDRQGGGSGLINRGAGETKLELDRRRLSDRISRLRNELEALVSQRQHQRKLRKKQELPVVTLVGYTNSGKSTIMNAMMEMSEASEEKKVFEKNMLFATLETSVRNIRLQDNKAFLLTDTVGFISKLPHHLVKAFRSTLEEVAEADMLIHVVDFSNPDYKRQIEVTNATLKELGADDIPMVYAFNKIDLVDGYSEDEYSNDSEENIIYLAAKKRVGLDSLIGVIRKNIFSQYVQCEMMIPYSKGNIVSYLNENAYIISTSHEAEGIILQLECKEADYLKYQMYVKQPAIG